MTARYAIYFAPALGSPWWEFGAHWLGRDEWNNTPLDHPQAAGIGPAEWHDITAAPRRYGFHATLKAPFRLSGGHTAEDLMTRMHALANTLQPVALGPLQAVALGDFVALVPAFAPDALASLAAACVSGLEDMREPLSEADLARQRIERLDAREQELLTLYGYPYVLERFRLHFTLSGPVPATTAQRVMQAVAEPLARLVTRSPLLLDRLCLFVEAAPGQPFRRITDVVLPA